MHVLLFDGLEKELQQKNDNVAVYIPCELFKIVCVVFNGIQTSVVVFVYCWHVGESVQLNKCFIDTQDTPCSCSCPLLWYFLMSLFNILSESIILHDN